MSKVRAKKFFLNVRDNRFIDRFQSSILSLITDNDNIYMNQYGKFFNTEEIGSFDIAKISDQAILQFYPLDKRDGEYSYSFMSFDTKQGINTSTSYYFGNTVSIASTNVNIGPSSSTTVQELESNYSSSKLLIELSSVNGNYYEYSELNLVTNDTLISSSEFGRITISDDEYLNQVGIGTYEIISSGQGIDIIFHSDINESLQCNILSTSFSNENFSNVSIKKLKYAEIETSYTTISSSDPPTQTLVSNYELKYNLGYFIVQITDTTNNERQISELLLNNDDITVNMIEYGNVYTNIPLGTFDSIISPSGVELKFTPLSNIDVEIVVLKQTISYLQTSSFPPFLDLYNAEISVGVSKLQEGDEYKKDFNLTHNGNNIFEKAFNPSSSFNSGGSLDLGNNLIYIPNHYFTTGEKVEYDLDFFDYFDILESQTTQVSASGTDIVYVDSTIGVSIGDYFSSPTDSYLRINILGSNFVSLSSGISQQINSGIAVTFSKLLEIDSVSTKNNIGISQTYISGVGNTDKLSGDLYVYKVNDSFIGLSTSPENALSSTPKLIEFSDFGIGNRHYIRATNQNTKCIICIDEVIQSPIISTGTTTTTLSDIQFTDSILEFSNIESFFSNDLIKIDDEIMKISSVGVGSTMFVEVQRPYMGTQISTHSSNSLVTKLEGSYNIVGSRIYFSEAPYGPIFDATYGDVDIRSSFQGRAFLRSGIPNTNIETYEKNYSFDNLTQYFNSSENNFELTSENNSITGISSLNSVILINNIFQSPENDYILSEVGSASTISFTGSATSALYDPNNASVPRGGIIVSVGSSNGFGYQPLVSAGGTAIISIGGTVQSISIGNSGSGYRPGIQKTIRVGVQTLSEETPNIEFIGTAIVSNGNIVSVAITNPGSGYNSSDPPKVIFDAPLSYSDLDLYYQYPNSGIGTQAKIDIVVGQGSSIIDFKIKNYGYSFNVGDILTISSGGLSGIPTDTSKSFEPFSIIVDRVYNDKFNGWTLGELQKLDDVDDMFDGVKRRFPLSDNGNQFAIISKSGSTIDLKSVLLVFINDVLQEPGVAYYFNGGSFIEFSEPPVEGSKCRILFYRGTPNIDVIDVDIEENIKIGDVLRIDSDNENLVQGNRLVSNIPLEDTVKTPLYNSSGISTNESLLRPIVWCKQRNDITIDGIQIGKDRPNYKSRTFPVCNLIQSVGVGSTQIFVDNVKTFFDAENENIDNEIINSVKIVDNRYTSQSIATAIVSSSGGIESIDIIDGGFGYQSSPDVSIQNPIGVGNSGKSILSSQVSSGIVTQINITSSGFGYTTSNPPLVFIDIPEVKSEVIENVSYLGDFGIITGIKATSVAYASTALELDLYIPQDSYLRNSSITNPVISESGLLENYYFKISNSKIGSGVISLRKDGSTIGIGTMKIDNIYQVISVSTASTDVYGVGNAQVRKVVVSVNNNNISGMGYSGYYGDYSWGIIQTSGVKNQYNVNPDYGVVGLNSSPYIRRYNYLRTINYSDI